MVNNATLQALARVIIAHRAYSDGEIKFANEVLAGAWDHTNRQDIANVLRILTNTPSMVAAWFDEVSMAEIRG